MMGSFKGVKSSSMEEKDNLYNLGGVYFFRVLLKIIYFQNLNYLFFYFFMTYYKLFIKHKKSKYIIFSKHKK